MQCSKCILDDINDKDISFDTNGVCNYCLEFESRKKKYTFTELEEKKNSPTQKVNIMLLLV